MIVGSAAPRSRITVSCCPDVTPEPAAPGSRFHCDPCQHRKLASEAFPRSHADYRPRQGRETPVGFARDGLHAAALTLSQEVEINRQVLREALASGNEYVRAIYRPAEPRLLYAAEGARPEQPDAHGGILLNRRA